MRHSGFISKCGCYGERTDATLHAPIHATCYILGGLPPCFLLDPRLPFAHSLIPFQTCYLLLVVHIYRAALSRHIAKVRFTCI